MFGYDKKSIKKAGPSPRLSELYSRAFLTRQEKVEKRIREKYEGRKTLYGWQPASKLFTPRVSERDIQREIRNECRKKYIVY